ncbi:MAG: hypothetical protein GY772_09010 [bacterium]|nr:hypothetical protein [bacterium]
MAEEPPPYRLWDFGSAQHLHFLGTGETVCVYDADGAGAVEGGPFDLVDHEEEAVLVGREGSDEARALHLARTVIPSRIALAMREGYSEAQLCLELPDCPASSQRARRWVEDLRCEFVARALEVPLGDGTYFRGEWYWHALGVTIEEVSYRSWCGIPWVIAHVFEESYPNKKICRAAEGWRGLLARAGLPAEHLRDSRKARASKRRQDGEEVCDIASTAAGLEFSVSLPGLLVLLAVWAVDKRFARYGGDRVSTAAGTLLKAILDMVLRRRTLHFSASSQCGHSHRVEDGMVEMAGGAKPRAVDCAAAADLAEEPLEPREAAARRSLALRGGFGRSCSRATEDRDPGIGSGREQISP